MKPRTKYPYDKEGYDCHIYTWYSPDMVGHTNCPCIESEGKTWGEINLSRKIIDLLQKEYPMPVKTKKRK